MKDKKLKIEIRITTDDGTELTIPVTKNHLLIFKLFVGGEKMKRRYDKFFLI
jgi:hypothetical protein